jgi:hypothetical protein
MHIMSGSSLGSKETPNVQRSNQSRPKFWTREVYTKVWVQGQWYGANVVSLSHQMSWVLI